MKKTISILMALVLALSMCAMTAFAVSSDAAVTMESSAAKANVGDEITISIDLKNDSTLGIGTLMFDLTYDTSAFQFVSGQARKGIFEMTEIGEFGGKVSFSAINASGNGTIYTAKFKVLKPGSSFTLTLTEATLDGHDGADVLDAVVAKSTKTVAVGCNHGTTKTNIIKAPTCTEVGEQAVVCSVCGETVRTESIAATGHSFGAWTVVTPATCKEKGLEKRVCACGAEETRAIAKAAHTPGEWEVVKDETCTEAGEKVQKCAVCGEVLATEAIPAKGHSLADPEITKMPTCTEEGEQKGVCSVCGDEVTEAIPALGHDVTEWTIDKDADCTEDGLKHGICNRCEEEVEEAIPAKGHAFGEWTVVKEATETEDGLKERVCSVCGEKETEVIAKLGESVTTDPNAPSIPKTSGTVVGSVAALAMLSMAAGVAAVTLKKKKEEEAK